MTEPPKHPLLVEIEAYSAETGLAGATITKYGANNQALFGRLKAGGDCGTQTATRVRDWIKADRQKRAEKAKKKDTANG